MYNNLSPGEQGYSDANVLRDDMVVSGGRLMETAEEMRRGCSEGALPSA